MMLIPVIISFPTFFGTIQFFSNYLILFIILSVIKSYPDSVVYFWTADPKLQSEMTTSVGISLILDMIVGQKN